MYCNSCFTPEINHDATIATLPKCSVNFNGIYSYNVHINEKKSKPHHIHHPYIAYSQS